MITLNRFHEQPMKARCAGPVLLLENVSSMYIEQALLDPVALNHMSILESYVWGIEKG